MKNQLVEVKQWADKEAAYPPAPLRWYRPPVKLATLACGHTVDYPMWYKVLPKRLRCKQCGPKSC